ncbi:hypothetical protein F5B22DRAFT_647704 [Xylaria bambusicola]|uniref:uncharacterized protein n=1 Tax=Xylaria bambusicola TaxID=326684 RepID=UPI0020089FC6|nr:uncharacterized protein F5B22DRAFT_647704 [Xylaria bambusicola]KAI0514391.1 hypothetical protein F5B22DRAFT_647704 [Xylaria bambusicola]
MSARVLVSQGAVIRGAARPLTHPRTAPKARQNTIIYPTRLLSSPYPAIARKYASTNAGKNPSSSSSSSSDKRPPSSEDDFKINFRDLGMNRLTKFVVYAAICVVGTMETIFWCKAIWRWWTGGEESEE